MPQPVRRELREPGVLARPAHDIADEIGTDRTRRRAQRQEHVAELAPATDQEIVGQRGADVGDYPEALSAGGYVSGGYALATCRRQAAVC